MPMNIDQWSERPLPSRVVLEGRYARLEPLDAERHGDELFASAQAPGAEQRFGFLFDQPPTDREAMTRWLKKAGHSGDPHFFAVIDRTTGRAEGRQALMRITPAHGVIEIGNILWGPAIARTRVATEALYLTASYIFDQLGYRRLEWKCDNNNEASKRAARRFGFAFEGVFRQHMIVKDLNRDTAWFAMIDADWPRLKAGYEAWLAPDNFDDAGRQLSKLSFPSSDKDVKGD